MHATIGIQHFWTYLMLGRNDFEEVDAILPRRINFRTEVESWVQFILPTKTQIKERLNSGENL